MVDIRVGDRVLAIDYTLFRLYGNNIDIKACLLPATITKVYFCSENNLAPLSVLVDLQFDHREVVSRAYFAEQLRTINTGQPMLYSPSLIPCALGDDE